MTLSTAGRIAGAIAGLLFVAAFPAALEDPSRPRAVPFTGNADTATAETTNRLIVRMRGGVGPVEPSVTPGRAMAMSASRARALSASAIAGLTPVRVTGDGSHVMRLDREMRLDDAQAVAARLARDPSVASAEPDRRKFPLQTVSDGYFSLQWNLREPAGGINVQAAWNQGILGQNVVVAVLDTGIIPTNRDLTLPVTRLVSGYDFVSADADGAFSTANDGDGRDSDPTDPGNWIDASEAGRFPFGNCARAVSSDWHGTHTAGIIAANANNDANVNGGFSTVGIAYQALIQPVRVLGKCGGYTSDIVDGIRWAAGLQVPGVPTNQTPANVVNLSLGSPGACSQAEQAAIDEVLNQPGVKAVIAAAGNQDAGNVADVAPANCRGVIAVAATDRSGSRTPYTNLGSSVLVSAPGGCFDPVCAGISNANGILSVFNTGGVAAGQFIRRPELTPSGDTYAYVIGTSEAAAHVSGVTALMVSANSSITPAQVRTFLAGSARPFPDCTCAVSVCGAGIVDADGAVRSALAGSAQPSTTPAASCPGGASIIGGVYADDNDNGARDPGETGRAGVTIILSTGAGTEVSRATTNNSGNYAFVSLAPGTYRVSKVQPSGVTSTRSVAGTVGGTAGINATSGIVLAATTFAGGYDFPLEGTPRESGGGGGGGCAAGGDGRVDPLFGMLLAIALVGIARRRAR